MSKVYEALRRATAASGPETQGGVMSAKELSQAKDEGLEAAAGTPTEVALEAAPAQESAAEPQAARPSPPALVPPPNGFFQGAITRFIQRAMAGVPQPTPEPPAELLERLDAVEVQMAALEELVVKRLEEGEGRTLHLVEKRIEVLQGEVSKLARRAVEGQVEEEVRSVRQLSVGLGVAAIVVASAALVIASDLL